ncbi:MAG: hypothetical protein M1829_005960 [Trizodia sp. TS-e1964]|nr:MAG: hypothetical protein M1829_005960 [Trizodia sp. TS-e1964]
MKLRQVVVLVASVFLPLMVGSIPSPHSIQLRQFSKPQATFPRQISKRNEDTIFAARQDYSSLKKPTAKQLGMRIGFLRNENSIYPRTLLDTTQVLTPAISRATELHLFPTGNTQNGVEAAARLNPLSYPYLVLSFNLPIEPKDDSNLGYLLMPVFPRNPQTYTLEDFLSLNLVAYYPRPTGTREVGKPVFHNVAEAITLEQYARALDDKSLLLPICLIRSLSDFEKAADATTGSQNLVYSREYTLTIRDWWAEMHRNIEKYGIKLS